MSPGGDGPFESCCADIALHGGAVRTAVIAPSGLCVVDQGAVRGWTAAPAGGEASAVAGRTPVDLPCGAGEEGIGDVAAVPGEVVDVGAEDADIDEAFLSFVSCCLFPARGIRSDKGPAACD